MLLGIPCTAVAGEPTDQLISTVTKLTDLLAGSPAANRPNDQLLTNLVRLFDERFDFAAIAARSLGNHWTGLSPDEHRQFVEIFTVYALGSYKDSMKSRIGMKISCDREIQTGDNTKVDTSLATSNRAKLSINYKLHLVGESWKVYHVDFEHMSMLKNYRSQFKRIIERTSFDDLIQRIKELRSNELSAKYCIGPIA